MDNPPNAPGEEGGGRNGNFSRRCCRRPRITIVKRWFAFGLLHVIDRCRRCDTYRRRVIDMSFDNGTIKPEITTKTYGETVKDAPPSENMKDNLGYRK